MTPFDLRIKKEDLRQHSIKLGLDLILGFNISMTS